MMIAPEYEEFLAVSGAANGRKAVVVDLANPSFLDEIGNWAGKAVHPVCFRCAGRCARGGDEAAFCGGDCDPRRGGPLQARAELAEGLFGEQVRPLRDGEAAPDRLGRPEVGAAHRRPGPGQPRPRARGFAQRGAQPPQDMPPLQGGHGLGQPVWPPGLGIYVLYGHPKCSWDVPARHKCNLPIMGQIGPPEERAKLGCYPIRSCHWYLGAHQDREDIPREFGEGSKGSRNIKWFCPICYTPYEAWAHLAKRIVVFGATPGCTEAFAAYIGETSNSQAAMITYLKGCALASRIGNRVPTPQDVLDAITALNEQCEKRLGNLANAYSLYSAQPADNPAHSAYRIICKHAALSLPHAGSPVKVLTYPEDTPVLASSDLDFILHFAACFVDLDSNQDNPGPRSAGRRAGWALREGAAKLLPGIAAVMAEGAAAAAAGAKGSQE